MSKIELPEIDCSPQDYVNQKLVPAVAQLQSIINELFKAKSTDVSESIDMMPAKASRDFSSIDKVIADNYKRTILFDPGSFILDRSKKYKVLFDGIFYISGGGHTAEFRLFADGDIIKDSVIQVRSREPKHYSITLELPHIDRHAMIRNSQCLYEVQARFVGAPCFPICRQATLTLVSSDD